MASDPTHGDGGVESAGEFEAAPVLEPRRRLPTQVIVLGVVLVVAGGVIYWMHLRGTAPGKRLKPVEMRYTIEQTQERHFEGEELILRKLELADRAPQVPLEDISDNPFRLDRNPKPAAVQDNDTRQPQRDEVLVKAERILDELHIQMVLDNPTRPLARINGKVYAVGDKIEDVLEITAIRGRSVTFRAKTLMRTIEMAGDR